MSWLQAYEISVPHYEIRNGKYVFALQLQRFRSASGSSSTLSSANNNSDDWASSPDSNNGSTQTPAAPAVASYVTAFQSYSHFRTLWKNLLRATKTAIPTASPLSHDGRTAFARRNRQTRPRLWSHHQTSSNQAETQATTADTSSATNALSTGACPCSNACCPFTRLHWVLKYYPFPPRTVLQRTSPALLEARRHALEQFVVTVREFFTGFPRSFLHSIDATERCRVLDLFSSFIGFSEELRTMAISRSPLLVAAWKADMLLNREQLNATAHSTHNTSSGSDATGYFAVADDALDNSRHSNNNVDSDDDADESDDDATLDHPLTAYRAPTVYVPSLQTLPENAATTPTDDEGFAPVAVSSSSSTTSEQYASDDDTDDESERFSTSRGAVATKYERGSSVYIVGNRVPNRTQPSLPKLQIRSAKVKTISSFLVDFRDHLLAQYGDILSGSGGRPATELDDARQWELALYLSCHIGQLYAVQAILARGTDPNTIVSDGTTPLHVASRSGHNDVVNALVASGADVNATDKLGMTPLLLAINHGDLDLVRLLLDSGADVNLSNVRNVSAAHVAVASQSLAILRLLLDYDAFVNTANVINGKTPLHIAAETGNYLICELLLDHGANVHQRNDSGCDAYGLAVAHGHVNVAELCRAFQSHSQRHVVSRDHQFPAQLQTQPVIRELTPLRRSILHMTMAASSTGGCSDHQSVKIIAQDGHSYAVL